MGRFSKAAVALGAVTLLFAGAGAYAFTATTATISVCVNHKTHVLYQAKTCTSGNKRITWNIRGPQGLPGAPATRLWAGIENSGASETVVHSKGVSKVTGTDPGITAVTFSQNVSKCSFQATLVDPNGGYAAGDTAVQVVTSFYTGGIGQDGHIVQVETLFNGAPTSGYDFDIAAFC